MGWTVVARKDFQRARSSRAIRILAVVLILYVVWRAYVFPLGTTDRTTTDFATSLGTRTPFLLLLPFLGMLLGYRAVVGERRTGTLALLLSLPIDRRDVVLGKLVGRTAVMVAVVVIALGVGGALVYYPFGSLVLGEYLLFGLLVTLYGFAFLSIGVALSAGTKSSNLATIGGFLTVFLFVVFWNSLESALALALAELGLAEDGLPDQVNVLFQLDPSTAFVNGLEGLLGAGANTPWYLSEWIALPVLLAWCIVPLVLSALRFDGVDL